MTDTAANKKKFDSETKAKAARAWANFVSKTKQRVSQYERMKEQIMRGSKADWDNYKATLRKLGIKSPSDARKAGVRWKPKADLWKSIMRAPVLPSFNAANEDEPSLSDLVQQKLDAMKAE